MRLALPGLLPAAVLAALLAGTLAACDGPAERAEGHYQSALAYLEAGDRDRASVAFRNVFRLAPDHAAARLGYAALLRSEGETRDALAQYQRLVETSPEMTEAHQALAELALELLDFDTATVHATRAFELDPAAPAIRALKATVDFRRGNDRPAAVAMASAVIAEDPGNVTAHLVLVADRLRAKDTAGALARVDAGLAAAPADEGLHLARLALLEEKGDTAAVGAELTTMNRLFPASEAVRAALVQWHLQNGAPDAAEAVLRAAADADGAGPGPALTLAQFLLEVRGPAAARAELEARIAAAAPADAPGAAGDPLAAAPYLRARAGLDFAEGDGAAAIAALRGLLAGAPASDATRDLEVALAEMLAAMPAEDGETADETDATAAAESAALVEKVLSEDRTHLGALKLRARAAIAGDRPDAAIADMRTALTVAPRDPSVMTILALAHERAGDRGLMGERLALAVEASNRGVEESLRYANFLMQEDRAGAAESVVVDALRRDRENRDLLAMLGRIHLARGDWTRAGQVAGLLRGLGERGDPLAAALATRLDADALAGAGDPAASAALLETLALDGPDGGDALAAVVRARLAAGEPAEARRAVDAALAADPASLPARFLRAGLDARDGDSAAAERGYRALVAEAPALPEPHQALFGLLAGAGRDAEAAAALDAGIAATGTANGALLVLRAGLRESGGDIAGAIADYETLYARSSDSPVVANNLASLLASQAPDADTATLERAFAIARRLRDSPVPEFQDTYGWLLFRRGDAGAAQAYLARAAAALPGNAQVQFHLGEAEQALGNRDAAVAAWTAALAAAEAGSPLPEADAVRARLAAPPSSDG